ncbi:MAG TPA: enoyl-CoA hydratase [Acidimicrobiales bacterium]|nr:enoyl-CoA hydratase [Acidimicrobiales bacterium]
MSLVRLEVLHADDPPASVGLVTLDDPARRNTMSLPLVNDLLDVMEAIEADESIGAVVLTGAPPAFCAGADLSSLASEGERAAAGTSVEAGLRSIYEGFLRVARCPLPTVAAVNGAAVGAGMNLALACDVRLAGRSARFDTRFVDLGLHPGGGHTFMLERIGGPQLAAALVLFGQRLDGAAAVEHALAWACVDDEALVPEAVGLAMRAASAPRALAVRTKETLARAATLGSHGEAVELELAAQVWSLGQPFFAARLAQLRARVAASKDAPS